MESFMVRFTSLTDIKCFVDASCMQNFEINAVSGHYDINAKSITGMLCVIIEKPIQINIKGAVDKEYEVFYKSIEKFMVT